MRVGLVLDHYDPRRGGVEQWTSQFCDYLLGRGDEVHIIASGFADNLLQPIVKHRVPPHRSRLAWAAAAETRLRELDFDVVHDMGAGWYCDILQPHGGCRAAWFEQSLKMLPAWQRSAKGIAARYLPRYREFEKLSQRQAGGEHLVLALSQMTRRDLAERDGVPQDRLRLVYNGVDLQRFSPTHRDQHREPMRRQLGLSDETLFLIVAHNLKLKGLPTLLKSMSALMATKANAHLLVVGNRRTSTFQRQARRLGVESHVTFLGPVDDPTACYAAADVYVQPTCYDCCSLVVLEALASGLPVITTSYNGAGELLTKGRHGYVVDDPFDPAPLADSMTKLLDGAIRLEMGINARALAEQHSFERNAGEIRDLYDEVVGNRE
jgi:UDP-glucose:(heptosyl)LPS alpha-1,3-glucosyltransferase